jgi:DNA polymerase-3 subunit chi
MTELYFYHLQRQPLERALPQLLEKSLERGWRVVVQAGSNERVEALDAHLWTYRENSFLPHGTDKDSALGEKPFLLTVNGHNPHGAKIRFLIDGVEPPPDADDYDRIVLLFDGDDPEAVARARSHWQEGKARGFAVTYLQQDDQGRWQRKV